MKIMNHEGSGLVSSRTTDHIFHSEDINIFNQIQVIHLLIILPSFELPIPTFEEVSFERILIHPSGAIISPEIFQVKVPEKAPLTFKSCLFSRYHLITLDIHLSGGHHKLSIIMMRMMQKKLNTPIWEIVPWM